jgi:nucleotide-binding universal stress UspA family protein
MFRNILVPTDGSALSRRAAEYAVRLAKEQNARVTGLWVGPAWEPNLYAYGDSVPRGFVSRKEHAAHVRKAGARPLGAVRKLAAAARVPCKCICVEGAFPYLEIIKAARRSRCDLIVMASHSRRGISRLLLGSQTSKVLALSGVPVLVVTSARPSPSGGP